MKRTHWLALGALSVVAVVLGVMRPWTFLKDPESTNGSAIAAFSKVPLYFIANQGQVDKQVAFHVKGGSHSTFLTPKEIVSTFSDGSVIRQQFVGANQETVLKGTKESEGKANFLIGNDSSKWHTNVPTFTEVAYKELWPGIDLVLAGQGKNLKSEYRVKAGADYKKILLAYNGIDNLRVSDAGDLIVKTKSGELREMRPVVYQEIDGKKVDRQANYVVDGNQYAFAVDSVDPSRTLVIDPELFYSTYLGGGGSDQVMGVAVNSVGNAIVVGWTGAADFPTASPSSSGAFQKSLKGGTDAFITKMNFEGTGIIFSTFLGGSKDDWGSSIAVDYPYGNVYVAGQTKSTDFPLKSPLSSGPFDKTLGGSADAFVTKLNSTGSALVFSTYLGGSSSDEMAKGIKVDGTYQVHVVGYTDSIDFPVKNQLQSNQPGIDAFVTRFNGNGTLNFSSYIGGGGRDKAYGVAVDTNQNTYVAGETDSPNFPVVQPFQKFLGGKADAFVVKLYGAWNSKKWYYSTYLGGAGYEVGNSIALDSTGAAYVAGYTTSDNFPVTPNAFQTELKPCQLDPAFPPGPCEGDAFVTKLAPDGKSLAYSTYLGGRQFDEAKAVAVHPLTNRAYIAGRTTSKYVISPEDPFPTTEDAFQTGNHTTWPGSHYDAFFTVLEASGASLWYSTYLGGLGDDYGLGVAVDSGGNGFIGGYAVSYDFPTTKNAFKETGVDDGFISMFYLGP